MITYMCMTSIKRRIRAIGAAAKTRAKADTVFSMSMDLNLPLLLYYFCCRLWTVDNVNCTMDFLSLLCIVEPFIVPAVRLLLGQPLLQGPVHLPGFYHLGQGVVENMSVRQSWVPGNCHSVHIQIKWHFKKLAATLVGQGIGVR